MQPAPIALPGCTYSVWVAKRTLAVTAVKNCAPRFRTNANNKPTANTNATTQTRVCPGTSSLAAQVFLLFLLTSHQ